MDGRGLDGSAGGMLEDTADSTAVELWLTTEIDLAVLGTVLLLVTLNKLCFVLRDTANLDIRPPLLVDSTSCSKAHGSNADRKDWRSAFWGGGPSLRPLVDRRAVLRVVLRRTYRGVATLCAAGEHNRVRRNPVRLTALPSHMCRPEGAKVLAGWPPP